jgi:hypothetical protein
MPPLTGRYWLIGFIVPSPIGYVKPELLFFPSFFFFFPATRDWGRLVYLHLFFFCLELEIFCRVITACMSLSYCYQLLSSGCVGVSRMASQSNLPFNLIRSGVDIGRIYRVYRSFSYQKDSLAKGNLPVRKSLQTHDSLTSMFRVLFAE